MIVVRSLPSTMIGNRKTAAASDFQAAAAASEDSFGSQDMSNLSLRDRANKTNLSLDLEPGRFPDGGDPSLRPGASTGDVPMSTPTPTQILFPNHVTEEQEAYVRGFSQALEEIYRQHGPPASSVAKLVESSPAGLCEPRSDSLLPDRYGASAYDQTWFCNDSKSSCFSVGPTDQKPSFGQAGGQATYKPPSSYPTLSPFPTTVHDSWHGPQASADATLSCGYRGIGGSSQAFVSQAAAVDTDFVVGSLPSTSFSSAGQKRSLSKMASQSLGSLTPSSVGSPSGSDIALHSRSVAGEFATLDMEEQEKLRLERKRAKNRLAAQKCQQKKVERIKQLENRVNFLREKNSSLTLRAASLRRDIDRLKSDINAHVALGCRILPSSAYSSCDVMPSFT